MLPAVESTAALEPRQVPALQYNCLCLEQAERVKDGLCSILVNALTGQRYIIIMNIIITVCDNACKVNLDILLDPYVYCI